MRQKSFHDVQRRCLETITCLFFFSFLKGGKDFGKITTWFSGGIEEGLVVATRV